MKVILEVPPQGIGTKRVTPFRRDLEDLAALAAEDADGVGGVAGALAIAATGATTVAASCSFGGGLIQRGAFAGGEEQIGFAGVLLGLEFVVAAGKPVGSLVRAALDDTACFSDEALVDDANSTHR